MEGDSKMESPQRVCYSPGDETGMCVGSKGTKGEKNTDGIPTSLLPWKEWSEAEQGVPAGVGGWV